jgi:hypothetical protein
VSNPSFDIAPVTLAQVNDMLAALKADGEKVTETDTNTWNIQGRKFLLKIEVNAGWAEPSILAIEVVHGPASEIESQLRARLGVPT